ncbi:MAG: GBS Bsp-like repeat-containing protein, partial [Bacteroides sp.]
IAMWSDISGQKDLQWFPATYSAANNHWLAQVYLPKYYHTVGTYTIHAYATDNEGTEKAVG